jgi:putative transcriptional regulator
MLVPISNRFAKLLAEKQEKENRFIPLAEVASDTKVSRKTLYKWEKNIVDRFDREVIEKLCKYFGVDLSDLLEYTPDDTQPKQKTARK